jgi:hypothetical protein
MITLITPTLILTLFLLLFLALSARYIYYSDLRRRAETQRRLSLMKKTWRRDLTAHETKIYNEMQAHWRRESRKVYKRLAYDKTIRYRNGK